MAHKRTTQFIPLNIAVLTVSDTRTLEDDTSGQLLADKVTEAGHNLADRTIVIDDKYQIRATVSKWIASSDVQVVLVTGGTGFAARDVTPEALEVLFDKRIEGFGEVFRQISFDQIKTSTIQSRSVAGMANKTVIFGLPGSNNACRTAWDEVLVDQLDSRHRPCNFVEHLKGVVIDG